MLEFLVLGKIPGTNFQITLFWYLLIALAVTVSVYVLYRKSHTAKPNKEELTQLQLL